MANTTDGATDRDLNGTDDNQRVLARVDTLKSQVNALKKEISVDEAQIAVLEKKLLESRQDGGDYVAIRGEVEAIDGRRVSLAIGRENGVEMGMLLSVFRDDYFICEIEIVEVDPTSSIGVTPEELSGDMVQRGDIGILLLDSRLQDIVGFDPGESLFDENIKRFKFRVPYGIGGVADTGQRFMRRYLGDDRNPPIYGMWGDPSTDSLIVIAPASSESAIREFLIKGEVLATTGFDVGRGEAESLETQKERLQQERSRKLQRLAWYKNEIIDLDSKANPDPEELKEHQSDVEKTTKDLDVLDRKLQVVNEMIERSKRGATVVGDPSPEP